MLTHRKLRSRQRRQHSRTTRHTLADRHALIRRCLFEPLEDRRLLATFSGAGGEIADNETTTFPLEVSASELIGDLNVSLNISHLDVQDLDVYLLGPAGSPRVELFTDVGGSGDDFTGTTLDDEATLSITSGTAPFSGAFQPEGSLSDFDDLNVNGTWTLEITDDFKKKGKPQPGNLLDWSLEVTPAGPSQPEIWIDNVTWPEGDSGFTTFEFTVTRSGDLSAPSSVDYFIADGTATIGDGDYSVFPTSDTLSFGIGEDSKTISVDVVGDTFSEGGEVFYVDLSTPINAVITVPRGTGLIVGDDGGLAPPPGLVSWWTADGTATDLMQRNDAELVDGTTYAPGIVGQAFDFDGVNDRVQLPDSESLKLTESLSIEAWIKADSLPEQQGEILFRGDDRGGLDPYSLSLQSSGSLRFEVASLSGAASVWAPLTLGQFTHVAGTLDDASGVMRLYLDGELISQITTAVRPFGDLDPASNPGIGIGNHGGDPDTPHNFPFDGLIDELSVYNRALTTEEVQRIYHTGSQGKVKMTVAKTSPDIGSVVTEPPTEYIVDFTFPVDVDSVQAVDLQVNGIAADGVLLNDPDTATFSFSDSPVITQGLQSVYMPENAVVRASDGLGLAKYLGEFRYDVTPLAVTYTDPAAGSDLVLEELTAPTTAILSMAGMHGGNGAWPVLYGTTPVSSNGLRVVVDEDTLSDTERSHTTEQLAFVAFDGTSSGNEAPYLRTGVVPGVDNTGWKEVILDHDYGSGMVVVATPNYSASDSPLVARVKHAQFDRFWITVQRADGSSADVSGVDVHYVVMQEGVYPNMEAVRFESTVTDGAGSWVGESRDYVNESGFISPVVFGQVMSVTEGEAFSVFWARGADPSSPPSSDALYVGKHVGEDPDPIRSSETIGYIVIEAGKGTLGGLQYLAGVGGDTVVGMDQGPTIPLYQPNLATMRVHFNEPIAPSSVGTDDLKLSFGTVAQAEATAADTAAYTLVGVAPMLTVEMTSLSVRDVYGNPMVPYSATYNPEDTKFYVVNGGPGTQNTFEYGGSGASLEDPWPIDSLVPAGAAANSAGTMLWIVDWGGGGGGKVMVYDVDGNLTGSWTAKKSDSAEGIATDGTDIWVVNTNDDVVNLYSGAASRVSGNQFPSSSFDLVAGSPTGITTDGSMLWITDVSTDQVYRYTTAGVLLSQWSLHSANTNARGLTIDPTGASNSVWVVDSDTDAVYEYDRDTGEFLGFFALDTAAGNSKPAGIADPPPPTVGGTMPPSLVALSVTEPSSTTSWLAGASYLPLERSWRPFDPHLDALWSEPVDEYIVPSDLGRDTAWVNEMWLLPLSPADVVQRPEATKAFTELYFHEIADEEMDLLDNDLLSLIATGR